MIKWRDKTRMALLTEAGQGCRSLHVHRAVLSNIHLKFSMIKIKKEKEWKKWNETQWASACVTTSPSLTVSLRRWALFQSQSPGMSRLEGSRTSLKAHAASQWPHILWAISPAGACPSQSSTKPSAHSPGFQLPWASLFPKPFNSPLTWFDEFLDSHQVHWEMKTQTASAS